MNSKTTSPFFTLFTPVFNGEKHIDRVFKSIAGQSFRDFEWIIVNDGSTDNTATLVKSFLAEHPEIDAVYHEQSNAGKHISWNKAVELARGNSLCLPMQMITFSLKPCPGFSRNGIICLLMISQL